MTDTQKKLLLTAGFALVVGGLIVYRVSQGPDADKGKDAGARLDAAAANANANANANGTVAEPDSGAPSPAMADSGMALLDGGAVPMAAATDAGQEDAKAAVMDAGAETGSTAHSDAGARASGFWTDADASEQERAQIVNFLGRTLGGGRGDAGPSAKRVRVGQLLVPSGKLGIYDCLGHDYDDKEEVMVPAGSYPLDVLAATESPTGGGDVFAAVVSVAGGKIATLKQAYVLQSGTMMLCVTSPEAIRAFAAFEHDAGTDLLMAVAHGDAGTRSWGFGAPPKSKLAVATVEAPSGNGPVYLGYDERGRLNSVVVPLVAPP